ncbi:hypothetical protein MSG28_014780 [Choristoneura fumiferana]|uniref:Uncharacterized protein n=1 Tax=Choristoneura fumiferana TaxID=7141 RepID=A0ACC0JT98_CHOFU|nr:hypothetical protein MSG28_014780 [Choristoneura fumiferana]
MESSACRRRASDADQSAAARAYSATAECEPVMVKEEPDCGVCGVSEAAMAEGLYADHEVKGELVIGPELLQQQDIIYSKHNVLVIKEESQYKPKLAGGADAAPGRSHGCPGDGPRCGSSTQQQYGLRSCFVRLERLPLGDLHRSTPPYSSACRRRASDADQSARAYSATAECEPVMVKEEPDCGVCGVSEAAMAEGLYDDHEVKGELVIGPELLQQQDIIYSKHNVLVIKEESQYKSKLAGGADAAPGRSHGCPGDGPRCGSSTEQQYGLRSCFVRLERLPLGDLHRSTPPYVSRDCKLNPSLVPPKLKPVHYGVEKSRPGEEFTSYQPHPDVLVIKEESQYKPKLAGGADAAPGRSHGCPGDGPRCGSSTQQQYGLRSCFVRLERLPLGDLHRSTPPYVSRDCKLNPSLVPPKLKPVHYGVEKSRPGEEFTSYQPHPVVLRHVVL